MGPVNAFCTVCDIYRSRLVTVLLGICSLASSLCFCSDLGIGTSSGIPSGDWWEAFWAFLAAGHPCNPLLALWVPLAAWSWFWICFQKV